MDNRVLVHRPRSGQFNPRTALAVCAVLLLAFFLRMAGLESVPPGWRDDETLETTVHAQIVLDGHFPLYFIQAEGHEPLYHYVSAGWIAVVGRTLFSVRLVSVFFGVLVVACAFRLTRQLFGPRTGLLAACLLAVSFWALMYSRTKIRNIAELPFILLGFSALFEVFKARSRALMVRVLLKLAIFIALGLYTYLAAVTALLCLVGFAAYLTGTAWLNAGQFKARLIQSRNVFAAIAIAACLYLPLANAIRANATRLGVVGGPLKALRAGDWGPLIHNATQTLGMFGSTGDNEALYNIPGRPVFGAIGFFFFAGGLLIALIRWRDPRYAFLIIWLGAGLAPGFASNPAASLGHTLTALPVAYILAVLPVTQLAQIGSARWPRIALAGLLLASVILRDLPDYFAAWPALPAVRYLYKAGLHDQARALRGQAPATYVLSGPLSKWDRVAFILEGVALASPARWVNAEWAIVFPSGGAKYLFTPAAWQADNPPANPVSIRFTNNLTLQGWTQQGNSVIVAWQVDSGYSAVEPDMGASVDSPPYPLRAFAHLLDAQGAYVAGSDRFDADAFALQSGDRLLQRHAFDAPPGRYLLEAGLYNPSSGERYLTDDGRDAVRLGEVTLP